MAIYDGQLQFTGLAGTGGSTGTDSPTTGTQTSTNTIDMGANVAQKRVFHTCSDSWIAVFYV